jgi:hypothetical protein
MQLAELISVTRQGVGPGYLLRLLRKLRLVLQMALELMVVVAVAVANLVPVTVVVTARAVRAAIKPDHQLRHLAVRRLALQTAMPVNLAGVAVPQGKGIILTCLAGVSAY